jgi:hypothetical protein
VINLVKKLLIVFGLLFTFSLVGCGPKEYSYSDFASQTITDKAQQTNMESGTYYIYLYGPSCEHCIMIKQEALGMIDKISKYNVYLVSVSSITDVNDEILAYANDDVFTPSLVKISNYKVADIYVGGTDVINTLKDLLN